MAIELRDRVEEGQMADLMALYRQTYWGKERSEEDVRKMLAHTDLVFALVDTDGGHLVGFARVLTDTVYKAFVFDVIVDEGRRGQGLVRRLMDPSPPTPSSRRSSTSSSTAGRTWWSYIENGASGPS